MNIEIINGNIIDIAPALGTWFIIFDDGRPAIEGLPSKQAALDKLQQETGIDAKAIRKSGY
jgi:hypothetical protein